MVNHLWTSVFKCHKILQFGVGFLSHEVYKLYISQCLKYALLWLKEILNTITFRSFGSCDGNLHSFQLSWSCDLDLDTEYLGTTLKDRDQWCNINTIPNHFFSFEQFFASILPETNIAPEKGWLEYVGILVSFWDGLLSGAMLVSGSVRLKITEKHWLSNHMNDRNPKNLAPKPLAFAPLYGPRVYWHQSDLLSKHCMGAMDMPWMHWIPLWLLWLNLKLM